MAIVASGFTAWLDAVDVAAGSVETPPGRVCWFDSDGPGVDRSWTGLAFASPHVVQLVSPSSHNAAARINERDVSIPL